MIFSGTSPDGEKHLEKIFKGLKTQTRRQWDHYDVGKTYAVQPKRTGKADPRGRIKILDKWPEYQFTVSKYGPRISKESARDEGGYTPEEYEALYSRMYGTDWKERYAYIFVVVK